MTRWRSPYHAIASKLATTVLEAALFSSETRSDGVGRNFANFRFWSYGLNHALGFSILERTRPFVVKMTNKITTLSFGTYDP